MPPNKRYLPNVTDLTLVKNEMVKGQRIIVTAAAGPRMAGRHGIVLGSGGTRHRLRVLLDGSKGELTLHARFVDVLNQNKPDQPAVEQQANAAEKR
ncbi:hypothetical protein [Bradyrhizobium sp. LA2.1]|uniref:hypothetical protein n=1 Tax=Bradyrhizobium sp. LA2.1 TaxID=3156376 RepID=UPI0033954DB9